MPARPASESRRPTSRASTRSRRTASNAASQPGSTCSLRNSRGRLSRPCAAQPWIELLVGLDLGLQVLGCAAAALRDAPGCRSRRCALPAAAGARLATGRYAPRRSPGAPAPRRVPPAGAAFPPASPPAAPRRAHPVDRVPRSGVAGAVAAPALRARVPAAPHPRRRWPVPPSPPVRGRWRALRAPSRTPIRTAAMPPAAPDRSPRGVEPLPAVVELLLQLAARLSRSLRSARRRSRAPRVESICAFSAARLSTMRRTSASSLPISALTVRTPPWASCTRIGLRVVRLAQLLDAALHGAQLGDVRLERGLARRDVARELVLLGGGIALAEQPQQALLLVVARLQVAVASGATSACCSSLTICASSSRRMSSTRVRLSRVSASRFSVSRRRSLYFETPAASSRNTRSSSGRASMMRLIIPWPMIA